jgi:hypothetical protein
MKKNEMCRACDTCGGERCTETSDWETWGKTPFEDLGVDGNVILK